MRLIRYNFLFVIGLVLTLGLTTAFAHDGDKKKNDKPPKGMGFMSVKTADESYPVIVDGQQVGMSGVGVGQDFVLTPGRHVIEITGPNGTVFKDKNFDVPLGGRNCICIKFVTTTITTPCPYRFHLEGPEKITEGDLVTFAAINSGTAPIPLRYAWKVSNGRVTSGLGTSSITVDSAGVGNGTINAELDVNDDVYDNKCRQVISVPTEVAKIEVQKPPEPFRCDEFEASNHDQDKARFDNCVIQLQNTPDAQMYVIIYPGTDRASVARNPYDRTSKFMLDYMVKTRGVDPRRIQIVKGGNHERTMYEIWIVPPGARPPVPQ